MDNSQVDSGSMYVIWQKKLTNSGFADHWELQLENERTEIRKLESLARLYEILRRMPFLLCISAGRSIRQSGFVGAMPQNTEFQSAGQKET